MKEHIAVKLTDYVDFTMYNDLCQCCISVKSLAYNYVRPVLEYALDICSPHIKSQKMVR